MMIEILLGILIIINVLIFVLFLFKLDSKNMLKQMENIQREAYRNVYDEFSRNREEFNHSFKQ